MRIPLVPVGSTPPRYARGRTILPPGLITPVGAWILRATISVLMTLIAPLSPVIAVWWLWGMRRRMWTWRITIPAVITIIAAGALSRGFIRDSLNAWKWVITTTGTHTGSLDLTPGPIHPVTVLASGWMVGTIIGLWAAFLAWWRTPPWRDRDKPKSILAKRREKALITALREGAGDVDGVVTLGIDTDTGQAVELPWADTSGHVLVTGAPGTGKSTTSMKFVRAAIRDGMFTAVVDMKGSPKMIEQIAEWTARWDRPLYVFSNEGPSRYDPFRSGDYTRKRDLLMATSTWTEAHYQAKAADYLLTVFYLLDILGVSGKSWLHTVADLLNPNNLAIAANRLPDADPRTPEARTRAGRVVDEAMTDPRSIAGMGPRVRSLTDTIMGQWVQPGEPFIDLLDVWNQRGVVVFSLPGLTHPEAAAAFGGLAVQDLKTLAGTLQDQGNTTPGLVFVDEFSTLGAHNITAALAMSRESQLRWMLATQDLGDLEQGDASRGFVQKVLTDTTIKIIHGIGDPETATRLAQLAGMKWGVQERTAINQSDSTIDITSSTQSGHGFIDRRLVPAIEPNDILHQGAGADSKFTLINKPGMWAITGAHTIVDESTVEAHRPTAPQHVPARFSRALTSTSTNLAEQGWWDAA